VRDSIAIVLLVLASCTPTAPVEEAVPEWEESPEPARPGNNGVFLVPASPLVRAEYTAPVGGYAGTLVVYEDGRAFLRERVDTWFEDENETKARSLRVPAPQMDSLRALLASDGWRGADGVYRQDGIADGGAVELMDAIAMKDIIVVNLPRLPSEVGGVWHTMNELHRRVGDSGVDPFAVDTPPELAILAVHTLDPGGAEQTFVVYVDGTLELCRKHDAAQQQRDASHGHSPCKVGVVDIGRLVPLRRRVAASRLMRGRPVPAADRGSSGALHMLQLHVDERLVFRDGATLPRELSAVLEAIGELRRALDGA
jgi:hypothetical protein